MNQSAEISDNSKRRTLRQNQLDAIHNMRVAIKDGDRRFVLQAPTAFGKTILAAEIAVNCLSKGNRAIFCVPMLILIDQTIEKFVDQGVPLDKIGVIQANHPMTDPSKPIQIASVQTLSRRQPPDTDIFVVDECHVDYKIIGQLMNAPGWERVVFIGLSATPWSRGLGKKYQRLIAAADIKTLIKEGSLSDFKVFAPTKPDLDDVRTVRGDFHEGDLSKAMNKPSITADVVSTWCKLGEGRPTILFAVDRRHAQELQNEFNEVGIKCGYIDGDTPNDVRMEIRRQFHSGEIKIVSSVDCLTVGMDWDVRCLIVARPTKSEIWHVQAIGRGLRTAPGKDHCLILDHAGNHNRLGMVTEIHYDALDDGKKKKKEKSTAVKKIVECPSCSTVLKRFHPTCPECGFVFKVVSNVLTADGELILYEANGQQHSVMTGEITKKTRQRWYSGMLTFARDQGYKPTWASLAYKEKFGAWPNRDYLLNIILEDVPHEIHRYCIMKVMRFKKQKIAEMKAAEQQPKIV